MGKPMRPMPIQPIFCSFFAIVLLLRGFRAAALETAPEPLSGGFMTASKPLQQRCRGGPRSSACGAGLPDRTGRPYGFSRSSTNRDAAPDAGDRFRHSVVRAANEKVPANGPNRVL